MSDHPPPSRRDFLAASAGVAAAGLMTGCSMMDGPLQAKAGPNPAQESGTSGSASEVLDT